MVRMSTGSDSKQDYQTPFELTKKAIPARFGEITFDLAAVFANKQHDRYYTDSAEEVFSKKAYGADALAPGRDWAELTGMFGGFLWLNPPFKTIEPWARKCKEEGKRGANILFLVPAAVGANWFRDNVFGEADRYYLNGRLSFIPGETYMKDCMVCHFHSEMSNKAFVWTWRENVLHIGESYADRIET